MITNKAVLSGCDILNLFVDEAGAFNSRCLGSAALPSVLWRDGFVGEVALNGVRGTVSVAIEPLEAVSSMLDDKMPMPEPTAPTQPTAPPQAAPTAPPQPTAPPEQRKPEPTAPPQPTAPPRAATPTHSEARGSSEGPAIGQPWVTAMLSPNSLAALADETDSEEPAAAAAAWQVSRYSEARGSSEGPAIGQPWAAAVGFGVPAVPASQAQTDGKVAAALPINLAVATLNVAGIMPLLCEQHRRRNHNFLPFLQRGVDPTKDLTWLAFGFDLKTKSFPLGDEMEYESGPAKVELATRLRASLETFNRSQLSPQFGLILTCLQDRIGRQLWVLCPTHTV